MLLSLFGTWQAQGQDALEACRRMLTQPAPPVGPGGLNFALIYPELLPADAEVDNPQACVLYCLVITVTIMVLKHTHSGE